MSDVRVTWNGKRISERVHNAAVRGLREGSEHLLTTANYTVPLETGDLMRSGLADVDDQALEAVVSYGSGPAAPYALIQHEDTTLQHDEGRRAKWLELALQEERRKIQNHIEDSLRQALR